MIDWYNSLKNWVIFFSVAAIIPQGVNDSSTTKNKQMENLVLYARKVEEDMYKSVGSKEEYERLLNEKMNKIRTELEEKRSERKRRSEENAKRRSEQAMERGEEREKWVNYLLSLTPVELQFIDTYLWMKGFSTLNVFWINATLFI